MYVIISDGGHQYRVEEGQILEVQRKDSTDLKESADGGATCEFERVLLVGGVEGGARIGRPVVQGAKVTAKVIGEIKGDKITIQKFRRRKGYHVKTGHRQRFLRVAVEKIDF